MMRSYMQCVLSGLLAFSVNADVPRTLFDYAEQYEHALHWQVPRRALGREDLDRWARMLDASESQRQFMEFMYEHFVERHNEFMDREAPRYYELAISMERLWQSPGPNSPEFAAGQKTIDQASTRIRREVTLIEHSYLDSIQLVLTEEQSRWLPILRSESARRNSRGFWTQARWTEVELRDVWAHSAQSAATPDERTAVEEVLADYEVRLTLLITEWADLLPQMREQLVRNRMAMVQRSVTADEGRARYVQITRRQLHVAQRVRRLTEQTLDLIIGLLSPDVGSIFMEAAKTAAFPELYPDQSALHVLFETIENDEEIPEGVKDHVAALFAAYRHQYQQVCSELEAFCIDWGDRNMEGIDGYQIQFLRRELEPLLQKRAELAREILSRLDEVLDVGWRERHAAMIAPANAESVAASSARDDG